ncbi:MAG TPA: hypothetical protein PKI66_03905 [Methanobacteriaceae archaeon]|jgi:hypothetical protein|nr:hypothetical protein [Euryarchaeota archaeon]HNR25845.1 hypothetical protein [Methanobacteriaceae archaeon]HNS25179.1 hypothetical protein [Methanobacteriaceae archaeon]
MVAEEGSGERLPAGELDVWLMKPDDEKGPWSVITIQIELESPLTPEMILKYLGTYLEVDGMEFEVMKAPNEHLVIAPEKALQELMKSCFKLNIKLDEFNVILMPLEKFKDKIEDI